MISNKWLELYQYIQKHIETLPAESDIVELLNDRVMFLSAQFVNDVSAKNKNQQDWLEHEAFTLVMSNVVQQLSLTKPLITFLFETLMAAQLCQLAMVTINAHKSLLTDDDYTCKCGLAYQQLGEYDLAKTAFEESLSLNAENAMTLCHLGFNYLFQGQTEEAIHYFEQSTKIAPDFVGGYQNLAGVYYQNGDFALAAQNAELAFSKDTSLVSTYITAISSYIALGEKAKADKWVNAAFEHNVSSIELVRLAGIAAHQSGRLEEALEALNHYLAHKPESFDVLNIRAHVKADLKLYAELEEDIVQLRVFEPNDEWSLEQLFLCYFHTERWNEAQAVMVQLNRLAPRYKITYRDELNTIKKKLSIDVLELS
ncbi:tetratricopeptide repeat protein [Enterovibrio makurazakiensis]|uniref:tetratricopeptide repeat protein n=1 Tax=Enterovibrio makurazakiensis TaxID=2910232 RepID=UPI003D21F06A